MKPRRSLFTPIQFVVILTIFVVGLFADVVLGTNSFFYRDFGVWAYPDAVFHRDCFWSGEVPLWNPYNNCGLPFLAQWNTITLYPLSLLYLLLPMPWSLNIFCLFHLWLAGVGMFLLARRWTRNDFAAAVAGMAYGLNGLMLHSLMWPNNIAALAWLPFVVLLVERARKSGGRWIVFAGVIGAVQMLAGAPEIILLTWLVAGAFLAVDLTRRRRLAPIGRFVLVAAIVALLCSVQLFPFFELMNISQRSTTFGDSTWSMPAWGWANFLVPLFHQSKSVVGVYSQDEQQWTSSYYVGIGAILLAIFAIVRVSNYRVRVLAVLGLVAVPLAMGEHTFLYPLMKSVLPQLGFARFPIKFVVVSVVALPLLAAFAVRELCLDKDRGLISVHVFKGTWLAIFLAVLAIVWASRTSPVVNESWNVTLLSAVTRLALLTLISGTLLFVRSSRTGSAQLWARWLVILLIGVDVATHAPRQNPTIAAAALQQGNTALAAMPGLGEGRAMVSRETRAFLDHAATANLERYYLGLRTAAFADCNLIDRIPKTDGFYSLYLKEEALVHASFVELTNGFPSGLADFLSVRKISSTNELFGWTDRQTALPMVTAGQRPILADISTTLKGLINPDFNPLSVVYLPNDPVGSVRTRDRSEARVEQVRVSTHRIDASVICQDPAMVVVSQSFTPIWRALVDGRNVPLLRANHGFQAVEVPAGRSNLTFIYSDDTFRLGLLVSAIVFSLCVVVSWRQHSRTSKTANQ